MGSFGNKCRRGSWNSCSPDHCPLTGDRPQSGRKEDLIEQQKDDRFPEPNNRKQGGEIVSRLDCRDGSSHYFDYRISCLQFVVTCT